MVVGHVDPSTLDYYDIVVGEYVDKAGFIVKNEHTWKENALGKDGLQINDTHLSVNGKMLHSGDVKIDIPN